MESALLPPHHPGPPADASHDELANSGATTLAPVGTWGTGVFSSDEAADLRDDWREALLTGMSPEAASQSLAKQHAWMLADSEFRPLYWIALAAAQHETGRLLPDVRDNALEAIARGGDVRRYAEEEPRLGKQRAAVLEHLAGELRGPARPPVRLRRSRPKQTVLVKRDVISVEGLKSKRQAVLAVVGIARGWPRGTTEPVLAPLRWLSPEPPSIEVLPTLPILTSRWSAGLQRRHPKPVLFVPGETRRFGTFADFGQVVARGIPRDDSPPQPRDDEHWEATYGSWRHLAEWIDEEFEETVAEMDEYRPPERSLWRRLIERLRC